MYTERGLISNLILMNYSLDQIESIILSARISSNYDDDKIIVGYNVISDMFTITEK